MKENTEARQESIISALRWGNKERAKIIDRLATDNAELRRQITEATKRLKEITGVVFGTVGLLFLFL